MIKASKLRSAPVTTGICILDLAGMKMIPQKAGIDAFLGTVKIDEV